MFTKNELEFKTTLNNVMYGRVVDVNEMNKEAMAMLFFDITSKIMMKQRGDDPSTWNPLVDLVDNK